MTKNDLVNYITENIGYPKKESYEIVETFFTEMKNSLEKKEHVKIAGFGVFEVKHKDPRIGRNPKTKQSMEISERNVLRFRPSQILRKKLNQSEEESN